MKFKDWAALNRAESQHGRIGADAKLSKRADVAICLTVLTLIWAALYVLAAVAQ